MRSRSSGCSWILKSHEEVQVLRMSLSSFPRISGCDDEELVEAVSVLGQHGFQTRRSESKAEGGKTQIDDARVRLAMAKDEFTEIAVIGDKDATLPLRYG